MALEQLRAFREGRPLESLGPVERLPPDNYPLLASSELAAEHRLLSDLVRQDHSPLGFGEKPKLGPAFEPLRRGDPQARTRAYLALIERIFAYGAKLSETAQYAFSHFFDYGAAAEAMAALFDAGVDVPAVAVPTLEWFTCYRFVYYGTPPVERVVDWAAGVPQERWPPGLRDLLIDVRGQFSDTAYPRPDLEKKLVRLVGEGPWDVLVRCEVWAGDALADLEAAPPAKRDAWFALLRHCRTATSARPSAKWLKTGRSLLEAVGPGELAARAVRWFPRVDAGRRHAMAGVSWENVDERQRMHEVNATVLRGLLWLCPDASRAAPDLAADLTRAVAKLATSAYRKIRGVGPRSPKVGNACVYALSEIKSEEAVGQLAVLKVRVKFGTAQKEIEKAFNAAAAAMNVPRDQIEEMGVPSYGLEDVGLRRETFAGGEFTAELRVDGRDVTLSWSKADGKPLKSVPAKVKSDHKEELKELQGSLKDIAAMLPAQSERIDSMFLLQKRWPMATWRERYLDHPLVGTLARRLIWTFTDGGRERAGIWLDGRLVDVDDEPLELPAEAEVALWHPIGRPMDDVLAWRAWLVRHEVRQPFKQAHREVYPLTDAERTTATYSNRFAAHVLRQHQFNALCAARGWKNKLRLMVDDSYPPASRELPRWGLRAEFWIEGIGDNYGSDTTESGAYLRVATDQVRFYRTGAAENYAHAGGGGYEMSAPGPGEANLNAPLPLEQVPPLVFSEVMRDVDLFVGVASVGNDPTWQDGGPDGRYRTYWQSYSFGELSETAHTRRAVLENLLPRLTKLRGRASLEERFLVVKGDLRTYKIHLGSGNILMEPNDQYLCIVPDRSLKSDGTGDVFLPFEGDATLSIILSKAFLLAADDKINDTSITRQIVVKSKAGA